MRVLNEIGEQSHEISRTVSSDCKTLITEEQKVQNYLDNLGAGDQGLMFGYATNETKELYPLTCKLSHLILK